MVITVAVDEAHFAEELSGAEDGQDDFLAVRVAHHDLEAPGQHDIERVRRVAGRHNGGRSSGAPAGNYAREHAQLLVRKAREQRHCLQDCRRDRRRHSEKPLPFANEC
jgi:hypothetical protein